MKDIYTLVDDIYKVVATKEVPEDVDLYEEIDKFGENCKKLMSTVCSLRNVTDVSYVCLTSGEMIATSGTL